MSNSNTYFETFAGAIDGAMLAAGASTAVLAKPLIFASKTRTTNFCASMIAEIAIDNV